MKKSLVKTRKFNKQVYKIYLHEPEYEGETWGCDIEITPYVSVETPENCFGYSDSVLFYNGYGVCAWRTLPNWIMKELEKINADIMNKLENGLCIPIIEEC